VKKKVIPHLIGLFILIVLLRILCIYSGKMKKMEKFELKLTSPAFEDGERIPDKYTCDGADINPPLRMENIPENTKSLALIVDDPDAPAGTWVHWVMWNINPEVSEIKENQVPRGAVQGLNDFKKNSYGGPSPPSGNHRYFFKLYALDALLDPEEGASKRDLKEAISGHIIARTQLMGTYSR
jgi:Raf kinase inhibitor-like YbhB/YbcL family protein